MQPICSGQISYYYTSSRLIFTREWDGYFLFFMFRMEMIMIITERKVQKCK